MFFAASRVMRAYFFFELVAVFLAVFKASLSMRVAFDGFFFISVCAKPMAQYISPRLSLVCLKSFSASLKFLTACGFFSEHEIIHAFAPEGVGEAYLVADFFYSFGAR